MNKTLKKFCENKFFCAAVLAVLVAVGVSYGFFISSIDGFRGEYTVFLSDFYTQYSAFAKYFADSSFLEKIYSFTKGFGEQTIGLNAYYTLSPLNFILLLFSPDNISLAFCVIIIFRYIFISESMYRYLCTHYKNYFVNTVFSLAWALYPSLVRNHYNVLWLEAIGFLPLLILGTERIIDGKGKKFFIIAYFLSLLSSYYITAMSSAYIFFYFFYYLLSRYTLTFKEFVKKVWQMAQSVIWAAALASPVLLPAFMSLLSGKFNDAAVSDWRQIKHRQINDFAFMLFEQFYINDSKPQLIGCVAMLFVLVAFFINRKISAKQRLLAFLLLYANTLAGLFFRPYSYIWTAFSNPIGHYFRHIFLYAFTVIILARISFDKLDRKTARITMAIMGVAYIFARGFYLYFDYLPWTKMTVRCTVASFAVCMISFALIEKKSAKLVLMLYMIFITLFQGGFFIQKEVQMFRGMHNITNREYKRLYNDVSMRLENTKSDDGFYRIEDTDSMIENQPMMFGYNGVSYFSSDYSSFIKEMSVHFGYPDSFYGTAYVQNQLTDSFFGIKYIMSYDDLGEIYESSYTGSKNLYYNKYALPLIFTADTNSVAGSDDGNKHIYNMFMDLTGINVQSPDGEVDITALEQAAGKIQENACEIIYSDGALLKLKADGKHVLSTIPYSDDWHIYVNGKRVNQYKFMDYFLAFDLDGERCDITMLYVPKGLPAGCAICAGAVAAGLALLINKKVKTGKENYV